MEMWVAKLAKWVTKLVRWVAKLVRWVAKLERWVAKLIARLLSTAALWVLIQTSLKITKCGRHKHRSGQHTLAGQKNKKNKKNSLLELDNLSLRRYIFIFCFPFLLSLASLASLLNDNLTSKKTNTVVVLSACSRNSEAKRQKNAQVNLETSDGEKEDKAGKKVGKKWGGGEVGIWSGGLDSGGGR
jgi:hypothetical protein